MNIPDFETLEEAKQFLRENWEKGTACPCCKQFVKLYKRKLTSSMAYALIMLYNHFRNNPDDEWVHVSKFDFSAFRGGDLAKIRFWGLIEPKMNEDTSKKDSGFWKLTEKGRLFVTNSTKVKSHIGIYNQQVYSLPEVEQIDIKTALTNKFDYEELMGYSK